MAEFEASLSRASAAETDEEAIRHLVVAADVYRGELLSGFYEEWVFPEQQRLHEMYVQALEGLVEKLERKHDHRTALNYALRSIRVDPFRASAHRDAIRLFLALGRRDMAERQRAEMVRRIGSDTAPEVLDAEEDERWRPIAADGSMPLALRPLAYEAPGGAVPIRSRYYVARSADQDLFAGLRRRDSIVLIKGPRQVGKTSLLARGLQEARDSGARVVYTHLQMMPKAHFASAGALCMELANAMHEQLELGDAPSDHWDSGRSAGADLRRFVRNAVLSGATTPVIWALDEVDRLLECPDSDDVFGFIRSWHDERALDPDGPFSLLTLAMAYSTEAHLLIRDAHQSPFNVGTRVALEDFTVENITELNSRHGGPLRTDRDIGRFRALVGGQPYLVRLGLYELAARGSSLRALEVAATDETGVFGDHLTRLGRLCGRDEALWDAIASVISGSGCDHAAFLRLRSAGIVSGVSPGEATMRCGLYTRYFARRS